jgi:hypothetical protein
MRRTLLVGGALLAAFAWGGCHSDDVPPPDVFVDFDAHGVLPDGAMDEFVSIDAFDAVADRPDVSIDADTAVGDGAE